MTKPLETALDDLIGGVQALMGAPTELARAQATVSLYGLMQSALVARAAQAAPTATSKGAPPCYCPECGGDVEITGWLRWGPRGWEATDEESPLETGYCASCGDVRPRWKDAA